MSKIKKILFGAMLFILIFIIIYILILCINPVGSESIKAITRVKNAF